MAVSWSTQNSGASPAQCSSTVQIGLFLFLKYSDVDNKIGKTLHISTCKAF